jgi:hypothetical protein
LLLIDHHHFLSKCIGFDATQATLYGTRKLVIQLTSLFVSLIQGRVVDRHRFDADPDPDFHVDADPDPAGSGLASQ